MKKEKLTDLKNYSNRQLLHHLINIRNNLPDNFLTTEPINTKKIITDKINKTCNCLTKSMKSEDVDLSTGEIVPFVLYNNSCNQYVLCPMCARRRAEEIWQNYRDRIESMAEKYDKKPVYMLTFTIEDQEDFNLMYAKFTKFFTNWMKMGQNRGIDVSPGEYSKIKAGIMGIEVTRGKNSKKFHVHGHMLAFCDEKLDYEVYTNKEVKQQLFDKYGYGNVPDSEMKKAAETFVCYKGNKDCKYKFSVPLKECVEKKIICDCKIPVSKITQEWYKATMRNGVNLEVSPINPDIPIKKQCREIVKYPVKTSEITPEFALDVLSYKEGKRFFRSYGEFINRNPDKPDQEEFNNMDIEEERPLQLQEIITQVYDIEKEEFTPGSEEDEHIALELYKRKIQIVEFMTKCTLARNHKNTLFLPIKHLFALKIEEYSNERKMDTIKNIDAIYIAYKYYLKYLYDKVLRMPNNIKSYKKKIRTMSKLEKYYYKDFIKLQLVPDESTE